TWPSGRRGQRSSLGWASVPTRPRNSTSGGGAVAAHLRLRLVDVTDCFPGGTHRGKDPEDEPKDQDERDSGHDAQPKKDWPADGRSCVSVVLVALSDQDGRDDHSESNNCDPDIAHSLSLP